MILVMIADTHSQHKQVDLPEGDILIHSGDFCYEGTWTELYSFANWLAEIRERYNYVVMTPGNHDFPCEGGPQAEIMSLLGSYNCYYLVDEGVELDGVTFYGAPWVPNLKRWAFYSDEEKLQRKWNKIPNNPGVLVTHGPPQGILDDVGCDNVGCPHLLKASQRAEPLVHVFGHIHEEGGKSKRIGKTTYVNASVLDENYDMVNEPIILEI